MQCTCNGKCIYINKLTLLLFDLMVFEKINNKTVYTGVSITVLSASPVCLSIVISYEPCHEIMALFVLRKLILQTRMRSHPVGLDV